jgi:hypothetical protein
VLPVPDTATATGSETRRALSPFPCAPHLGQTTSTVIACGERGGGQIAETRTDDAGVEPWIWGGRGRGDSSCARSALNHQQAAFPDIQVQGDQPLALARCPLPRRGGAGQDTGRSGSRSGQEIEAYEGSTGQHPYLGHRHTTCNHFSSCLPCFSASWLTALRVLPPSWLRSASTAVWDRCLEAPGRPGLWPGRPPLLLRYLVLLLLLLYLFNLCPRNAPRKSLPKGEVRHNPEPQNRSSDIPFPRPFLSRPPSRHYFQRPGRRLARFLPQTSKRLLPGSHVKHPWCAPCRPAKPSRSGWARLPSASSRQCLSYDRGVCVWYKQKPVLYRPLAASHHWTSTARRAQGDLHGARRPGSPSSLPRPPPTAALRPTWHECMRKPESKVSGLRSIMLDAQR